MSMSSIISWPDAPFTKSLVLSSLNALSLPISFVSAPDGSKLLQWSSYDEIDHELTHLNPTRCLSSSYIIRKALIRKHFLSRCIHSYLAKNPSSVLANACPTTYEIDISFVDELEELWADELWELGEKFQHSNSWWILKPGMADRGMGIRLFNSKEALQRVFEEFESDPGDDLDDDGFAAATDPTSTSVITSQLRHFVIQEYIDNPLLIDPSEIALTDRSQRNRLKGHKFHLRTYCVAKGALELYLYDRVLALFSAVPYHPPHANEEFIDLAPHLTNTSLQTHVKEDYVRLLQELVGCQILSGNHDLNRKWTREDTELIVCQMGEVISETFRAALQNPVHFQALPNAFELFGVDFLIVHDDSSERFPFCVMLLEINAEPAIELTGLRLSWILEDLFVAIGKTCVEPFFSAKTNDEEWATGETKNHLLKCMKAQIRS